MERSELIKRFVEANVGLVKEHPDYGKCEIVGYNSESVIVHPERRRRRIWYYHFRGTTILKRAHGYVYLSSIFKDEIKAFGLKLSREALPMPEKSDCASEPERTMTVIPPEGYEIDKDRSTFENIVFNRLEPIITTFDSIRRISGFFIDRDSSIKRACGKAQDTYRNLFVDEKHTKSALAMAQISQLMPHYGGAITGEEWGDCEEEKYGIARLGNEIEKNDTSISVSFSHIPYQRSTGHLFRP